MKDLRKQSQTRPGLAENIRNGLAVPILSGHSAGVRSATYSPDGKHLVTASSDQTARIWVVSVDELLARVLALIQRDAPLLTPNERRQYGLE